MFIYVHCPSAKESSAYPMNYRVKWLGVRHVK